MNRVSTAATHLPHTSELSRDVMTHFAQSADAKRRSTAMLETAPNLTTALECLRAVRDGGGTIYAAGDSMSRFSADHLTEEFQVRYRAGKPLGRADRPAVSAFSLSEYPSDILPELGRRLTEKDCLVVFGLEKGTAGLSGAVRAARERGAACVVVSSTECAALTSTIRLGADILPLDGTADKSTLLSSQRAVIHGICEAFEPEYSPISRSPIVDAMFESARVDDAIAASDTLAVNLVAARNAIGTRTAAGGSIFLFGNGGSACDAQELTRELGTHRTAQGEAVFAFNLLQAGYLTCAVNDGHEMFQRGVECLRGKNDVVIAFSTSGVSENVNKAVREARLRGALVIALTGKDGGALAPLADIALIVPSNDTGRIQEAHAVIGGFLSNGLR